MLPKNLHLHHIDQNRENDKPENLILLKHNHHRKVHNAIKRGEDITDRESLNLWLRKEKITCYFLKIINSSEWKKK